MRSVYVLNFEPSFKCFSSSLSPQCMVVTGSQLSTED